MYNIQSSNIPSAVDFTQDGFKLTAFSSSAWVTEIYFCER